MAHRDPRELTREAANSFRDRDGQNPFADAIETRQPASGDIYGSPQAGATLSSEPPPFEPVLVNRATLVLGLGVTGLMIGLVAALAAVIGFAAGGAVSGGLTFGIPAAMLALAAAIPGWIVGRADLQAMRAGAMRTERRRATQIGHACSVAGALLSVLVLISIPAIIISAMLLACHSVSPIIDKTSQRS
jgi:hypothetical protein